MEKIKHFIESDKGKDILVVLIVILVGLGSFELGRLSKENNSAGLKIIYPEKNQGANVSASFLNMTGEVPQSEVTAQNTSFQNQNSGKKFFASKSGSKYYGLGCSAGKNIKQENRIYFTTGEEAEGAGYELSSSCR